MQEIIISLISGLAGGNAIGALAKKLSLGPLWNSVVGILGGALGPQLLHLIQGGKVDTPSIIGSVLSAAVSGGALTSIIGAVKGMLSRNS